MSRTILAALAALLVAGCRSGAKSGSAHDQDIAPLSHTGFAAKTQLFVEFEPLVAGKEGRMAAHFTRLADWKPLTQGKVVATLTGGAVEERFEVEGPSSPGIFRPVTKPSAAGKRRLTLAVTTSEGTDVHDLGEVTVHPSLEAAARAAVEPPEQAGLIAFLMEQQWKTEFGTAVAAEQQLKASVPANGSVRARSDGEAHVTAPVAGRLVTAGSAFPRVGMEVRRDQLLAVLAARLGTDADPATLELAVTRAKLALELAQRERERVEGLFAQQAVAERRVIEARSAEALAVGEHAAAARRLAQFQGTQRASGGEAAGRVELRAPVSGVIAAVQAAPGAFIAEGQELFHVVDLDRLWLEVLVPEADVGRIVTPTGASFTVDGYPQAFEVAPGKGAAPVAFGGVVDPQSRTVPLVFEVPNPGRALRAGMYARVRVFSGQARKSLAIPASAVVDDGKQEVTYVLLSGEVFERRPVRLGTRDGDLVEVVEGLAPGERVVSRGAWQVRLAAAGGALPAHGHIH